MAKWKIAICGLLVLFSCNKDNTPPNGNLLPPPIGIIVLDSQGNNLIQKNTTNLIYGINEQGKKFYTSEGGWASVRRFQDTTKYKYYWDDLGISLAAQSGKIKTYYLDLAGKVDTIFIDIRRSANPKNGTYEIKEILLNGKEFPFDLGVMPHVNVIRR